MTAKQFAAGRQCQLRLNSLRVLSLLKPGRFNMLLSVRIHFIKAKQNRGQFRLAADGPLPFRAEFSLPPWSYFFSKRPPRPKKKSERFHAFGESVNRLAERLPKAAAYAKMVANRDLVCKIVREAMLLSEVLSGSYKFKVLALNRSGDTFAILMDIPEPLQVGPGRQVDVEALVVRLAEKRHGILIQAMYWRSVGHQSMVAASHVPHAIHANLGPRHALPRVKAGQQSALSSTNFGEIN